jgi:carbamoyltransferase
MQSNLNLKLKYRESFRPFAPSVLEEDIHEYFDIRDVSPYMLMVAPVKKERQIPFDLGEKLTYTDYDMLPIVNARRSDIPAVTHVDYSARIQSVSEKRNPKYYELIAEFKKLTGCSVIVNTSFNVRGEPIVCTPEDAYKCFMRTEMDVLVLEDCILYKEEQPKFEEKGNWRDEYELD